MNARISIPDDVLPLVRMLAHRERLFAEACERRAHLHMAGQISMANAVDDLQEIAENWGIVAVHGQDAVQDHLAFAFSRAELEQDDEASRIVARWEATDRPKPAPPSKPEYRTPESTVQAFWYVVGLNDPPYLKRWLAKHPSDSRYLKDLWEAKCHPSR